MAESLQNDGARVMSAPSGERDVDPSMPEVSDGASGVGNVGDSVDREAQVRSNLINPTFTERSTLMLDSGEKFSRHQLDLAKVVSSITHFSA